MRNRIGTFLGLAITLSLTLVVAAGADEARRPPHGSMTNALLRMQPFGVSGQYSGTLAGEIRIDGISYRLSPDATIYEIGRGLVPQGTAVEYRYVYLSGLKVRGSMLVYGVILRPASESVSDGTDPGTYISIRDEGAAK